MHVELSGTGSRGMTIVDRRDTSERSDGGDRPDVKVAVDVDAERFLAGFAERILRQP